MRFTCSAHLRADRRRLRLLALSASLLAALGLGAVVGPDKASAATYPVYVCVNGTGGSSVGVNNIFLGGSSTSNGLADTDCSATTWGPFHPDNEGETREGIGVGTRGKKSVEGNKGALLFAYAPGGRVIRNVSAGEVSAAYYAICKTGFDEIGRCNEAGFSFGAGKPTWGGKGSWAVWPGLTVSTASMGQGWPGVGIDASEMNMGWKCIRSGGCRASEWEIGFIGMDEITLDVVDDAKPTLEQNSWGWGGGLDSNAWYGAGTQELRLTAKDGTAGVKRATLKKNGANPENTWGSCPYTKWIGCQPDSNGDLGLSWDINRALLPEGENTITVDVEDGAGNTDTASNTIKVDLNAPAQAGGLQSLNKLLSVPDQVPVPDDKKPDLLVDWAASATCVTNPGPDCGEAATQTKTDWSKRPQFRLADTPPGKGNGSPISSKRDARVCRIVSGLVTTDCTVYNEIDTATNYDLVPVPGNGEWQLQTRYRDSVYIGEWNGAAAGQVPTGPILKYDGAQPGQPDAPFNETWLNQARLNAGELKLDNGTMGPSELGYFKYRVGRSLQSLSPTQLREQGLRVNANSSNVALLNGADLGDGKWFIQSVAVSGSRVTGNATAMGTAYLDRVNPNTLLSQMPAEQTNVANPSPTVVRPKLDVSDPSPGSGPGQVASGAKKPGESDQCEAGDEFNSNGCGFIRYKLDGASEWEYTPGSTLTLPNAGEEDHTLIYQSRDGAENWSDSKTATWTQDTLAPDGTASSPSAGQSKVEITQTGTALGERCVRSATLEASRDNGVTYNSLSDVELNGTNGQRNWNVTGKMRKTWTNGVNTARVKSFIRDCAGHTATAIGNMDLDACTSAYDNSSPGEYALAVNSALCNQSRTVQFSRNGVSFAALGNFNVNLAGTLSGSLPYTWVNSTNSPATQPTLKTTMVDEYGRSNTEENALNLKACPEAPVTSPDGPGSFKIDVEQNQCMSQVPTVRWSRNNGLTYQTVESASKVAPVVSGKLKPTWPDTPNATSQEGTLETTFTDSGGYQKVLKGRSEDRFPLDLCSAAFFEGGAGNPGTFGVKDMSDPSCDDGGLNVEISRDGGESYSPLSVDRDSAGNFSKTLSRTWSQSEKAKVQVKIRDSFGALKEFPGAEFTVSRCLTTQKGSTAPGAFAVEVNNPACTSAFSTSDFEFSRNDGDSWQLLSSVGASPSRNATTGKITAEFPRTWPKREGEVETARVAMTLKDNVGGAETPYPKDNNGSSALQLPLKSCEAQITSDSNGAYSISLVGSSRAEGCASGGERGELDKNGAPVPIGLSGSLQPSWNTGEGNTAEATLRGIFTDSTGKTGVKEQKINLPGCAFDYSSESTGSMTVNVGTRQSGGGLTPNAQCLAGAAVRISRDGANWNNVAFNQGASSVSAELPPSWLGERPTAQSQVSIRDTLGATRVITGSVNLQACSASFSNPSMAVVRYEVSDPRCLANARISISRDGNTWTTLPTDDTATTSSATIPADWQDERGSVQVRARFTDTSGQGQTVEGNFTMPAWTQMTVDAAIDTPGARIAQNARRSNAAERTAEVFASKKKKCKKGYKLQTKKVKGKKKKVCAKVKTKKPASPNQPSNETPMPSDQQLIARVQAGGTPVANTPVTFQSRVMRTDGDWETIATRLTDSSGYARYDLYKGPSTEFRAVVGTNPGANMRGASSSPVARKTASGIKLTAPKNAKNRKSVKFSGEVVGGYIPSNGVRVDLLGYGPKKTWVPVQSNVKTDAAGKFTMTYRFSRTTRTTKYQFKARLIAPQVGYPFESGESAPATITVRR